MEFASGVGKGALGVAPFLVLGSHCSFRRLPWVRGTNRFIKEVIARVLVARAPLCPRPTRERKVLYSSALAVDPTTREIARELQSRRPDIELRFRGGSVLLLDGLIVETRDVARLLGTTDLERREVITEFVDKVLSAHRATQYEIHDAVALREALLIRLLPNSHANLRAPLCQPVSPNVSMVLAAEINGELLGVSGSLLDRLKISEQEAYQQALTNLDELTPSEFLTTVELGGRRVVRVHIGDFHDAARIMLPRVRKELLERFGGSCIAIMPSYQLLLCAEPSDDARETLSEMASLLYDTLPYPVTKEVLLLTLDGLSVRWSVFAAEDDDISPSH